MRSLFLAAAVSIVALLAAAAPAEAQTRQQRQDARSDSTQQQQQQNVQGRRGGDVFVFGRNMGTDPDPRIRSQIKRDTGAATGGDD